MLISDSDGLLVHDGWLCHKMNPSALQDKAILNKSFVFTTVQVEFQIHKFL